ncbi:MAG: hypothetical protein M1831_004066 [Alyxoria varia]|nr:MAG: hypothetical protein M1831_004066 [Alyxoria varia]
MPSYEQPQRPPLATQSSSGSVAQPSAEPLSTSLQQKPGPQRHVVGQGRIGPRIPSYSKNVNKLQKLAPTKPDTTTSTGPKASHVKRNSSSSHLQPSQDTSVDLRKNHSETSLKQNRSSGQLTKLGRPSTRNVIRAPKRPAKPKHTSSNNLQAPHHTVRFDLGRKDEKKARDSDVSDEEDGWTNASDSRSPTVSVPSTRQNSVVLNTSPRRQGPNRDKENRHQTSHTSAPHDVEQVRDSSSMGEPVNQQRSSPFSNGSDPIHPTNADAGKLTSHLLKRNVSFNAAPQLSSIAATPSTLHSEIPTPQSSGGTTLNDGPTPEIVSRFLNEESASGPNPGSGFLSSSRPGSPPQRSSFGDDDLNDSRRSQSLFNVAPQSMSRTQQRLNLEREAVANESHNYALPPIGLMQSSRLSNLNIPYPTGDEITSGRVDPHLRQLLDQINVGYRRMRLFHNPAADSLKRLRKQGQVPRGVLNMSTKAAKKVPQPVGAQTGQDDNKQGLSQSLRAENRRKPRVMFQGINNSKDDSEIDSRRLDQIERDEMDETGIEAPPREDVKEICRRLWMSEWELEGHPAGGAVAEE